MTASIDAVGTMGHTARWTSHRRAVIVTACLAFVPVATLLQLWRVSGERTWRTVWAEDGSVFYRGALDDPLTKAIDMPYNGYAHALPRALAAVGTWLPAEWFSAWAAASSTLVVSLLALFLYFASAPLLRAPVRRAILALSLLALPVLPLEVLAALANLQWMLPIACLFAVLFPVDGWRGIAVRSAIVIVAPITSPLSLIAAPFALYQVVQFLRQHERWQHLVVPGLYLEACLAQLVVYQGAEHQPLGGALQPPLSDVLGKVDDLYGLVVLYEGLDTGLSSELWHSWGRLGWVAIAAVGLLVSLKLWRAEPPARWWIAGFALASPAVFAFTMVQRPERVPHALSSPPYDVRYWVVPQFLLLIALLVPPVVDRGLVLGSSAGGDTKSAARSAGDHDQGRSLTGGLPWKALALLTALWLAVAVIPSYRQDVIRSNFPSWPDQVADAQAACHVNPNTVKTIEVSFPEWRVRMTCKELGVDPGQ